VIASTAERYRLLLMVSEDAGAPVADAKPPAGDCFRVDPSGRLLVWALEEVCRIRRSA